MHNILKSTISENLPLDFLRISVTYDESIIREKAIYLIFKTTQQIYKMLIVF